MTDEEEIREPQKLIEGDDYSIDPETGLLVLSASFLLKRGYCCETGCRNCPYRTK